MLCNSQLTAENDEGSELEERIHTLELSLEAVVRHTQRLNQQILGYLLVLSLPMSNKKRIESTVAILNTFKLDDQILQDILLRYFREGVKSEMSFEDLLTPIVNSFGFDRLWNTINVEDIRKMFGELGVLRWNELEKASPCKNEVSRSG